MNELTGKRENGTLKLIIVLIIFQHFLVAYNWVKELFPYLLFFGWLIYLVASRKVRYPLLIILSTNIIALLLLFLHEITVNAGSIHMVYTTGILLILVLINIVYFVLFLIKRYLSKADNE